MENKVKKILNTINGKYNYRVTHGIWYNVDNKTHINKHTHIPTNTHKHTNILFNSYL